ncbi:MAG: RagB/SusD family nutrient uptake outer membrane protein [Candidatus Symbiothrix sp.]|nr:RagB/SusD family nutrient uptake outer membrane protein [Candidatus Symbiothrix sp.]
MALFFYACEEGTLDTAPTNQVSGKAIFKDVDGAQVAVNGIYRALFVPSWSVSWASENPGMLATNLAKDLHGEDHLMAAQGQGWFFYDYVFGVDGDYTTTSGRQYAQWNFYYTIVSQANYIIAQEENLVAMGAQGKDIVAQAYTLRGMAYTNLYEWFCQGNYALNKTAPGVPVYTEPTNSETEGKPRGTVEDVFVQINNDFKSAVDLFTEAGTAQTHPSHLDLYAANLLWARAALIQENWGDAEKYANAALAKPNLTRVATISELGAFNDVSHTPDVLWGFEVITDQTGPYAYYLSHMDPDGGYGARAPQCIDAWLWSQLPATDARKTAWWEGATSTVYTPYTQIKFRYSNFTTNLGDAIYLRAEEAILIAAEAACRQSHYGDARNLLLELGSKRDTDYAARLTSRADAATYNADTHGAFTSLLDEILFQRRVELWSEGLGRAYDLRRLNLGYTRNYADTNHPSKLTLEPGDLRLVTLIPQKEFDGNKSFTVADQNPR